MEFPLIDHFLNCYDLWKNSQAPHHVSHKPRRKEDIKQMKIYENKTKEIKREMDKWVAHINEKHMNFMDR